MVAQPIGRRRRGASNSRPRSILCHGQRSVDGRHALRRLQCHGTEDGGQAGQARVGSALQAAEKARVGGPLKILTAKDQTLIAAAKVTPQLRFQRERHQRGVDNPSREMVNARAKIALAALRVLIIAVADLVALLAGQGRYIHAVIVDQPQLAAADDDVAVLQIAVADGG